MSLQQKARDLLDQMGSFQQEQHALHLEENGVHFNCTLVALDTLGCAFSLLSLRHEKLEKADFPKLQEVAEQLSAKLTYLLEDIGPVEQDAEGCTVLLRSKPPEKADGRTQYYEIKVARGGTLSLVRYEFQRGTHGRTTIPAQVTRQVFGRLINDMASVG